MKILVYQRGDELIIMPENSTAMIDEGFIFWKTIEYETRDPGEVQKIWERELFSTH